MSARRGCEVRGPAEGRVGVCSCGRIGLITGREAPPWGESWVGFGVFDGTPWAARNPTILTAEDEEAVLNAARVAGEVSNLS